MQKMCKGKLNFLRFYCHTGRDADCGVPLRSAHELGAGKIGEGWKDGVRGTFTLRVGMEVQVTVRIVPVSCIRRHTLRDSSAC